MNFNNNVSAKGASHQIRLSHRGFNLCGGRSIGPALNSNQFVVETTVNFRYGIRMRSVETVRYSQHCRQLLHSIAVAVEEIAHVSVFGFGKGLSMISCNKSDYGTLGSVEAEARFFDSETQCSLVVALSTFDPSNIVQ